MPGILHPSVPVSPTNSASGIQDQKQETNTGTPKIFDWLPPPSARTPLILDAWTKVLAGHPNPEEVNFVLHTIQHGACINFEGDRDIGSCAPNLASTKSDPAFIDQYIHEEIKAGRMFGPFDVPPFPNFRASPVGLVPKDSSGWRLINHLSFGGDMAINHSIAKMECKLGSFDEAVDLIHKVGRGAKLIKLDVKAAFRLVPVRTEDLHLLGLNWNGKYYVDAALPFGLSSSPPIWERFSRLLRWCLIHVAGCNHTMHYVDDFLIVVPPSDDAEACMERALDLMQRLGVPVSSKKLVGPTCRLEYLGHELNTTDLTCQVALEKKMQALKIIESTLAKTWITRVELQSVLGRLFFLTRILPQGRAFLGRGIALLRGKQKKSRYRVTAGFVDDLKWWQHHLPIWPGVALAFKSEWESASFLSLYTDASEKGAGAFFNGSWFSHKWTEAELALAKRRKRLSLPFLELLAVGHAVSTWAHLLSGKRVCLFSDNQCAVHALNYLKNKDERLLALVRQIISLCLEWQFVLRLQYIASLNNVLADPLSRLDIDLFQERCPHADQDQTQLRPLPLTIGSSYE